MDGSVRALGGGAFQLQVGVSQRFERGPAALDLLPAEALHIFSAQPSVRSDGVGGDLSRADVFHQRGAGRAELTRGHRGRQILGDGSDRDPLPASAQEDDLPQDPTQLRADSPPRP